MELFLIAALIGVVPAAIAKSKGRSFALWWAYGTALFVLSLPHSLIIRATDEAIARAVLAGRMKKCPNCSEAMRTAEKLCPNCGRDMSTAT
jgi:hypothetical protein